MADKPRYPAKLFHHLKRYPIRHCKQCGAQLTPRLHGGKNGKPFILETVTMFKVRCYCNLRCSGKANAHVLEKARAAKKVKVAPAPEVEVKQQTVIDQLRSQLPPKAKPSPVAKPVQLAKKEVNGQTPKVEPPKKSVQPKTEKPQSFYNNDKPKERFESEIERERIDRMIADTWDPTPKGKKIAIDVPLKLALFRAFAEHEEEAFLELFGNTHLNLVRDYKLWRDMNPALRERLAA